MGLGALGFGVYQIMWSVALRRRFGRRLGLADRGDAVFTALLAVVSGADLLTRTKLIGSLVWFAGVGVIVASGPGLTIGGAIVGDALTLAAAVCWSIHTAFGAPIWSGPLQRRCRPPPGRWSAARWCWPFPVLRRVSG